MSEINRRDINRCTCHCGGDMFYRHLHAASCPVSVNGDEAPISENAALRAEVERLTRERDVLKKELDEQVKVGLKYLGERNDALIKQDELSAILIAAKVQPQTVQREIIHPKIRELHQQLAASQARVQELEATQVIPCLPAHAFEIAALEQERDRLRTALERIEAESLLSADPLAHLSIIYGHAHEALRGAGEEPGA